MLVVEGKAGVCPMGHWNRQAAPQDGLFAYACGYLWWNGPKNHCDTGSWLANTSKGWMQLEKDTLSLQTWLLWVTSQKTQIYMTKYIDMCNIYLYVRKREVFTWVCIRFLFVCGNMMCLGECRKKMLLIQIDMQSRLHTVDLKHSYGGRPLLKFHNVSCLLMLYQSFKSPTP